MSDRLIKKEKEDSEERRKNTRNEGRERQIKEVEIGGDKKEPGRDLPDVTALLHVRAERSSLELGCQPPGVVATRHNEASTSCPSSIKG